jgi:hypothetical protein
VFSRFENLTLSASASATSEVTWQWFKNKRPVVGATNSTLTILSADVGDIGDYSVEARTADGEVADTRSAADDAGRLVRRGVEMVIEAEDFNYGGGQSVAFASVMPLQSDLYRGRDGVPGVDFHLVGNSTTDPSQNGNGYRNGWIEDGIPVPYPTGPAPDDEAGNVDVVSDNGPGKRERPDFVLLNNYKIGWNDPGEWYNYTRTFRPGIYSAVAAVSRQGIDENSAGATLSIVKGDVTRPETQEATIIGRFLSHGTGDWGSLDLVPFELPDGQLATFFLRGKTTLRATLSSDADIDYLLFYYQTVVDCFRGDPPLLATLEPDGRVRLSWCILSVLQTSRDAAGPFEDLPDTLPPFWIEPTEETRFWKVRQ